MNRADTGRVLAAIAEYDHREINADVITHWHEHIGHLDTKTALEAVAIHHKTSTWRITPAAVIDLANQIATRTTAQRPMRRAVGPAYQIAGAINYPCPHCGADAGHYCTSATGQEAFAPCISRLTGAKTQVA
ncbi:hypothetical protein [Nocardia sp. NPDC004860]|uniref:zinc finger domain-containing protein n=1 Tax=Nocardia sp. NPDC004860 TaxID=3154557 RepID=UPI0033AF8204